MSTPECSYTFSLVRVLNMKAPCTAALVFTLLVAAASVSSAAEQVDDQAKDSTGTNPINFTNDFRIYLELQGLNAGPDSGGQTLTFEYRRPLADRWQFRTRLRGVSRSFDVDTTTGVGDFDIRILHVPHATKSWAVAVGLEAILDTATNDLLGEGKWSLGPQVFLIKFAPFGLPGTLFAPAYQHVFHVAGDGDRADINRSLIDLFILWTASDKKTWVLLDPQIVIDHENDREFGLIEAEAGQMMFGGLSSYLRPGVGIGADRPVDWNVEVGFKVIWR